MTPSFHGMRLSRGGVDFPFHRSHLEATVNTMDRPPEIRSVTLRFATELFSLETIEVAFGNGAIRRFDRLREGPPRNVMIVPITDKGDVLFVREFSAGLGVRTLKLPTGRVIDNESSEAAARRELREEIGLDFNTATMLRRVHAEPGHSDAATDIVLATDLFRSPLRGDEPEPLRTEQWPLDACLQDVDSPEITDARTLAALFIAGRHLHSYLEVAPTRASPRRTV